MALFRRRDKQTDETRSGGLPSLPLPIIPPFPGTSIYGTVLASNPDQALQVPAVWACVRLIADTVSMLPCNAFQRRGGQDVAVDDPRLIRNPSAGDSFADWLYMLLVSLLLRGNAYAIVAAMDGMGRPLQLELQHPDDVDVYVDRATGRLTYHVNSKPVEPYANGAGGLGSLWHMKAFRMPGLPLGLSPIQYGAATLGIELESTRFALNFFRNGAHPTAVVTTEQNVTQDQAQTVKERIMAAVRDRKPAVLGAGLKWQTVQVSPEESQFLQTQQYNAGQIARFFGIPADMIGAAEGKSMTYANVEQRNIQFLTYAIQPWLNRVELALKALVDRPTFFRFDTSELLRTDMKTTFESFAIGVSAKFIHPDEARAKLQLPPLTEKQKAELDLIPLMVRPTGDPSDRPGAMTVQQAPAKPVVPEQK